MGNTKDALKYLLGIDQKDKDGSIGGDADEYGKDPKDGLSGSLGSGGGSESLKKEKEKDKGSGSGGSGSDVSDGSWGT